ncbi:hypothetical protein E2C01_019002 [Portunus trituberculatus]|uniref:Uncharacterized protein n=1 Tax=Portunus trituberculatus TaxID=210409 RepID=A0A5B7DXQ3_PORTR|nr:hypothetical protein [Portunus trituberculatus]
MECSPGLLLHGKKLGMYSVSPFIKRPQKYSHLVSHLNDYYYTTTLTTPVITIESSKTSPLPPPPLYCFHYSYLAYCHIIYTKEDVLNIHQPYPYHHHHHHHHYILPFTTPAVIRIVPAATPLWMRKGAVADQYPGVLWEWADRQVRDEAGRWGQTEGGVEGG